MRLFDPTTTQRPEGRRSNGIPAPSSLEVDFPGVEFSRIAERESWRKEVHRPATSTHKWWAKRLGSIFRGIVASATSETAARTLEAYGNGVDLEGITVFDPFAGSGTTVVEAAKLGARPIGIDINPVATLVQRQAVQRWDPTELRRAFDRIGAACRPEIDRVHRSDTGETVLYYFWVATARCPECATPTRLFSSHVFAQHAYPKRVRAAHIVCPTCLDVLPGINNFDHMTCRHGHTFTRQGAVTRGSMTCPNGHASSIVGALDRQRPDYELYAKLVLGADGTKRYERITDFDRGLYDDTSNLYDETKQDLVVPYGDLDQGENTRQAIRWGFTDWPMFFNARQLYSLGLLGAAIRDLDAEPAEREALTTLFSGTAEFNNLFCSYKGEGTGAVRHMFSHHILRPERTPLEAHPWGTPVSSGSFSTLYATRLERALAYKAAPHDQILRDGQVIKVHGASRGLDRPIVDCWDHLARHPDAVYLATGDSSDTDLPAGSVDLVVTDPPYMDNVHYSELADFFHAWLRQVKPFSSYPETPTTRRSEEVQSTSASEFETAIARVWSECARVLKPDGILAFTFHQARVAGWVALVRALGEAAFVVTAIQPVKGEMSTSSTKNGKEPSNLDSIVVCRRTTDPTARPLSISDPYRAASIGAARLLALSDAGIAVGVGDIRSVIRGHVLSTYTADPAGTDLADLTRVADTLADAYTRDLRAAPRRDQPSLRSVA